MAAARAPRWWPAPTLKALSFATLVRVATLVTVAFAPILTSVPQTMVAAQPIFRARILPEASSVDALLVMLSNPAKVAVLILTSALHQTASVPPLHLCSVSTPTGRFLVDLAPPGTPETDSPVRISTSTLLLSIIFSSLD